MDDHTEVGVSEFLGLMAGYLSGEIGASSYQH
jgi:hypothetical protein